MKAFLTGILLVTLWGCTKEPAADRTSVEVKTNASIESPLARALKETETYYAPHLPRMVDDETRLESVRATASELHFASTFPTTLKSELDLSGFDSILKRELEEQARRMDKLNSLLQLGATLVYSYKDKEGAHVSEVRITPESAVPGPLSAEDSLANAKLLYGRYVQYVVNFDVSLGTLYTPFPKISMTRNYPDGISQTKTVPAWRYKEFIAIVMPTAKKRGDASKFSDEAYEKVGDDKVRIKVKQYSVLGGYWGDVTLLVVRTGDKWLIAEHLTVSEMPRNAEEAK